MLSGRGLCDELITRPEESYRLCCVIVCDLETSRIGAPYIYNVRLLRVKGLTHYDFIFSVCTYNELNRHSTFTCMSACSSTYL